MTTIHEPILSQKSIDDFKRSLICTLSLSSKELFHSNMIGWLLENNLNFARKFFGSENLVGVGKVAREKHNFDLLVTANYRDGNKNYVIENKVKSLPDAEQIRGYQNKAKVKKLDAEFILLSMLPPDNAFRESLKDVRVVSYNEVYEWLSNINKSDEYTDSLLEDYRFLILTIIRIKSASERMDPKCRISFERDDEKILQDIRLFDVAQKIRFSCLAELIDHELNDLNLPDLNRLKEKTEVSLTRSLGLLSIKIRFEDLNENRPVLISIQIQGDQYRLSVETPDGSDVLNLAKSLQKEDLWLNPTNEIQNKILKFGKSFRYSYSSIKGISVGDLVSQIKDDISRLFQHMGTLERSLQLVKRPIEIKTNTLATSIMNNENKSWSEGLQQETRDAISEMRFNPDGKLHFKSHGKGYAFIAAEDLMRGKLSLSDTENGQVFEFANTDELLAAGWAVD